MSASAADVEQQLAEALDMEQAAPETPEVDTPAPVEYTAIEQEAMDMGNWKRKEDFEAEGGDPEIWSSAHEFVKYGKLQNAMKEQGAKTDRIKREFDDRVEGLNKLHKAQREADIAALREKQRVAVDEADGDAYDRHQKSIDSLESQSESTAPAKDPLITKWEADNAWIEDDSDPRAATATGAWNTYVAKNPDASVQQALDHVNAIVAKITPAVPSNPQRNAAPATETNGSRPPRGSGRKLTMNDLSNDERFMWSQTGSSMWGGDESKYLKACADARKGA